MLEETDLKSDWKVVDLTPPQLRSTAEAVHAGELRHETVRSLLAWWQARRRGYLIVEQIRRALTSCNLKTTPDFEFAYFDGPVTFELLHKPAESDASTKNSLGSAIEQTATEEGQSPSDSLASSNSRFMEMPRIGHLRSATLNVTSVHPDAGIEEAITKMLAHDYSQLPVMVNPRGLRGIVSWKSIGRARAMGRKIVLVKECTVNVSPVAISDSLFKTIPLVVANDCVLVKGGDNTICGIVTTADISEQFALVSEPFLLIGQIENDLRLVLECRFATEEILKWLGPIAQERRVSKVSELTFGEYVRIFERPEAWERLKCELHRATFIEKIEEVREIRNDVMHFNQDPLDGRIMPALRRFADLATAMAAGI